MRHHILLVEKHVIEQMLLEDRLAFLRSNYLKRLEASNIAQRLPQNIRREVEEIDTTDANATINDKLFAYILNHDPDPTKRHAQWLLNLLLKGNMQVEDLAQATELLTKFMAAKRALPVEQRDINRYRTLGDLALVVDNGDEHVTKREIDRRHEKEMFAQADVLLDTSEYRVVVPKTQEASCFFGVNTRWCTAATHGRNFFQYYNDKGPLYIVLHKPTNRRWQFHFESDQYMDEMDRPINIYKFINEHPKIAQFFEKYFSDNVITYYKQMPVVRDGENYVIKRGLGIGKDQTYKTLVMKNGQLVDFNHRMYKGWPVGQDDLFEDGEFIDLLNTLEIRDVARPTEIQLARLGIFLDKKTKTWGYISTVGEHYKSKVQNGVVWNIVTLHGIRFIDASEADDTPIIRAIEEGGTIEIQLESGKSRPDETEQSLIVELLVDHAKVHKLDDASVSLDDIDTEFAAALAEKRPEFADPVVALRMFGPKDARVHTAIRSASERNSVDIDGTVVGGDRMIYRIYDSPKELGEESGGEQFDWFQSIAEGENYIEVFDIDVSDDHRRDLLHSVEPSLLKKIGEFMAATYADWIEEQKKDDPDYEFDVTSVDDILEMHREVRDDDLEDAFRGAVTQGVESGTYNQAISIYKKAFEDSSYVYFLKNGEWVGNFEWDTKCAIIVPVSELAHACTEYDYQRATNWLEYVDESIDPREPYYGLTEYDEQAAARYFAERIGDFIKSE